MTVDQLLDLLQAHMAALRSSSWPRPHGPSTGPAFYLDMADTEALIAELTQMQHDLATARSQDVAAVSLPTSNRQS